MKDNIITSYIFGRAMAGPDLSGQEEGHRGKMAADEARHREEMTNIQADQEIDAMLWYSASNRMRRVAVRRATDNLLDELQKANVNHPLVSKEAFDSAVNAELDKEFAKTDEEIKLETLEDLRKFNETE